MLEEIFAGGGQKTAAAGRKVAEEHGIYATGIRLNEIYQQSDLAGRKKSVPCNRETDCNGSSGEYLCQR